MPQPIRTGSEAPANTVEKITINTASKTVDGHRLQVIVKPFKKMGRTKLFALRPTH